MLRLLVVEDEPLIAALMVDWLSELGYQTIGPASTVSKALDLIKSTPPDGAILDVSLVGEDSAAVAEELRARAVPFAFASGHTVNTLAARYPDVPALNKPYDFAAVQKVVTGLLGPAPNAPRTT